MEPCAPGVTLDGLRCPVPSEGVNALHHLYLDFHIHHFYRQLTPKVSVEEVVFWSEYASHLENWLYCHFRMFRVFAMFIFCSVYLYRLLCAYNQSKPHNSLFQH